MTDILLIVAYIVACWTVGNDVLYANWKFLKVHKQEYSKMPLIAFAGMGFCFLSCLLLIILAGMKVLG